MVQPLESPILKPLFLDHAIAGSISGLTQAFINGPTELLKIQMQVDSEMPNNRGTPKYKNSFDCAKHIVNQHGYKSLSKGMGITIFREIPAFAIYFGVNNLGLELMNFNPDGSSLEELKPFLSGGLAGMASWYINYPVDCIKTRIQSVPIDQKYSISQGWNTLKQEGQMKYDMTLKTSGMRATLLRAFICNSVTFGTLSLFLRFYDQICFS